MENGDDETVITLMVTACGESNEEVRRAERVVTHTHTRPGKPNP